MARYAVYAYLFLIPSASFAVITAVSSHDVARIAQVILASLCAVGLAVDLVASRKAISFGEPDPRAYGLSAALSLCLLASVASAAEPNMALRELAVIAGCFSIAEVVATAAQKRKEMVYALVLASILHAPPMLLVAISVQAHGLALQPQQVFVGFDNPRFLNHVQTVTLPLLAFAVATPHLSATWRMAALSGLFAGFFALFLTGGRATMVALVVGACAACALLGKRVLPLVYWSVAAALAGFLAWVSLTTDSSVTANMPDGVSSLGSSDSGRFYLWNIARQHIGDSPIFGIGPMHFAHGMNAKAAHPHNIYLQIAAEWGLPALGVVVTMALLAFLKFVVRVKEQTNRSAFYEGAAILITWIAVAVDACFSGNLVMPVSQVWIAFLSGWAWAFWRSTASALPALRDHLSLLAPLRVLVSTVLLAWLWYSIGPEVGALDSHLQRQLESFPPVQRPSPRFWSHGWF